MDCEACTDRLVDLLYGELEETDAESARAHVAECESCAGALARLEKGRELASLLVIEEPPAVVRNAVLAAARERAATRAPAKVEARSEAHEAREAPRRDQDEDGGLWSSFLRWLGGFAMGPQVAMAMMLLLMVGIGLWYLPGLRSRDPADPHAILDPAPGDEVGPSAGLEPAQPLELEADPRTGRIRPRDDEAERAPAQHAQRAEPPPRVEPVEEAEAEEPVTEGAVADLEVAGDGDEERARVAQRPRAERQEERVIAEALPPMEAMEMDLAPGEAALAEREAAPAPVAPQQGQAPAYAASAPSTPPSAMQPSTPRVAPMPSAIGRTQEEVAGPPGATDSRYALAQAAHHRARNLRQSGNCRAAIPTYQRMLAENPTYAQAHEARLELADCYRTTGNIGMARRILEQSARDPRVASRAQRELVRLEAAERAMQRQAETERTPDPPARARESMDEASAESPE